MMPEMGKYGAAVLWSYAASVVLIGVLVAASLWQAARVKKALREVEARQGNDHG